MQAVHKPRGGRGVCRHDRSGRWVTVERENTRQLSGVDLKGTAGGRGQRLQATHVVGQSSSSDCDDSGGLISAVAATGLSKPWRPSSHGESVDWTLAARIN